MFYFRKYFLKPSIVLVQKVLAICAVSPIGEIDVQFIGNMPHAFERTADCLGELLQVVGWHPPTERKHAMVQGATYISQGQIRRSLKTASNGRFHRDAGFRAAFPDLGWSIVLVLHDGHDHDRRLPFSAT
jgi:hypothetical protein